MVELNPKMQLIENLDTARRELLALIEGVPGDFIIYADSGWLLKDILSYLAAWEDEATRSIRAFLDGGSYIITAYDNDDAYNAAVYQQTHEAPFTDVYASWARARDDFKQAVAAVPLERFEEQMIHPWRLKGTMIDLVNSMVDHEREHAQHIATVLRQRR